MRRLFLIAVLGLACSSCAFMNRWNRPLLNVHNEYMVPDSTAMRWVMSPVLVPTGLLAGVTDVVLVHPLSVMDDAWHQAASAAWRPTGGGYLTESAIFPLRVVATPPYWTLNWLSRSIFDIPRWPPSPARLEKDLQDNDVGLRMLAVEDLHTRSYSGDNIEAISTVMINASKAWAKDDAELCEALIGRLPEPLTTAGHVYLAELARGGRGRLCAAAILRLFRACMYLPNPRRRESPEADRALKTLTDVYDALVTSGHREAELTIAVLASYNVKRQRARALSLYVVRSLARRNWPLYAEAAAFLAQVQLLSYSEAARIEAMDYEWRALRVRPSWPRSVAQAVARLQGKNSGTSRQAYLVRQQNVLSKQLRTIGNGHSKQLLLLTESLVDIKTMLDAEVLAERLVKGTPDDLRLFMGNPIKQLRAKEAP